MVYTRDGNTYRVRVGDLLSVSGVPLTRQVIAGTGMTGGGQLSSNVTLSIAPAGVGPAQLANTGVTPGVYGGSSSVPVLTVDAQGRVTAASNASISSAGLVPDTRLIIAGTGLSGGGPLSSNVTLSANLSSANPLAGQTTGSAGVAVTMSRADHRHPAVNLGVDDEVDGVLGLSNGGTAKSLVPQPGAVVWSGADGLYIGPAGTTGQVLVSGGTGAPTWGSALIVAPTAANHFFGGPAAGPAADPTFRSLVNADIPSTLSGKTITSATITGSTINSTAIGGSSPSTAVFTTADATTGNITTVNATTVNATTVDTTNLEATNLKAKDGTAAGSIADTTGVVTLNSAVLTTADINGGTIDATTIGATTPAAGTFTSVDTDYVDFAPALSPLPANQTGRVYYNNDDQFQTLAFQMNGNRIQHVGEELYYRVKLSAPATKGQVLMFTGTLGTSGGLTAAPATGLLPDQSNYILGVAAETGTTNDWVFVVEFGEVKGINTTGGAEVWTQGQVLYYNPAVAGGLTKNKPTTPNAIALVAAVVNVGTSNGILFVRPTFGSVLGGTDGNVEFSTLNNGDIITYDGVQQRWENAAQSTLAVGTATNLAGGAAGSVPYQTAAATTGMLAIGTAAQVLKVNSGATAPEWVSGAALSKTDDTNVTLTLGGAPTNALLAATSLTLGWTGQLSVGRGGTGAGTFTANGVVYGNSTSALQVTAAGTTGQVLVGNTGSAPSWAAATGVAVTSLSFGTTGLTPAAATQGAITVAGTLITTNGGTGLSSYTAGDLPYYAAGTALSKLGIGTNGQILTSSGTAPQWTSGSSITVGTATNAVNTGITDDTSTAATVYPTWVTANTGNLPQKVSSTKLTFNPSTGVLTATGGIGGGVF
jgi:hypothetical protein